MQVLHMHVLRHAVKFLFALGVSFNIFGAEQKNARHTGLEWVATGCQPLQCSRQPHGLLATEQHQFRGDPAAIGAEFLY